MVSQKILIAGILWLGAIATSLVYFAAYENRPGEATGEHAASATDKNDWPSKSLLAAPASKAKLLIFLHPRCACSHASLKELARLMEQFPDQMDALAVVYAPASKNDQWVEGDNWQLAKSIPHLQLFKDKDGAETKKFKVNTSGQILLFNPNQTLAFRGGITPARGHEGDSRGAEALREILSGSSSGNETLQKNDNLDSVAFGCAIFEGDAH